MIDIEEIATWPKSILNMLIDELEVLRNFELVREKIDAAARNNPILRYRRPANPFHYRRASILQRIEELVADDDLLGFHCTRLHSDDIASIKQYGLHPLSSTMLRSRVQQRINAGDIPTDLSQRLLSDHQADDDNRKGTVW